MASDLWTIKTDGMSECEFWQRAFLTYARQCLPDVAATYADAALREMRERTPQPKQRHRFDPDKPPRSSDGA